MSHTFHLIPRGIGMFIAKLVCQFVRCFAYNLQLLNKPMKDNGIFFCHFYRILFTKFFRSLVVR